MNNRFRVIAIAAVTAVLATGCSAELDSRGGQRFDPAGTNDSDVITDVDFTVLYRNVRNAPNLIVACTDGIAWMTTTSGASVDIERAAEFDVICADKEYEGSPSVLPVEQN